MAVSQENSEQLNLLPWEWTLADTPIWSLSRTILFGKKKTDLERYLNKTQSYLV